MGNCLVCGKEFRSYKSTEHKKKYCSKSCKDTVTHIKVNCLVCGKSFKVAKSRYNSPTLIFKCCSEKCYALLKKRNKLQILKNKTHQCSNCGKIFISYRQNKSRKLFCSQSCSKDYMRGENNPFYKTGTTINSAGYKCIKVGEKYLYEHRLVMEEHLGRKLNKDEVVHHKDGNKLNNDISNLELMQKRDHDSLHQRLRK